MSTREPVRHDRLAIRLSVIISRLMVGETLSLSALSDEFGVSERTLRRDFHQRLMHLDIVGENGTRWLNKSMLRDPTPGALAFARNIGITYLIPSQNRQLMRYLTDEAGTSPCLIGYSQQLTGTVSDSFQRLAEAIYHHLVVGLLVKGVHHDDLEPYRLIYQHSHWYLVGCKNGAIHAFQLDEIISVSLTEQHFQRCSETSALITEEAFIKALPHFHFISNVIRTFQGVSSRTSDQV